MKALLMVVILALAGCVETVPVEKPKPLATKEDAQIK